MKFIDDPQSIMELLVTKNNEIGIRIDELPELLENKSIKEKEYSIIFAEIELKLKTEGLNVSVLKEITKGTRVVAEAKFKMDVANGIYKIAIAKIENVHDNIDTLRSFLAWHRRVYVNANMEKQ